MQTLSSENVFDLYENELVGGTQWFYMKPHFNKSNKANPKWPIITYYCYIYYY